MRKRAPRLALCLAIAVGLALYADLFWTHPRPKPSDFTQLWAAARTLVAGESPYAALGPSRTVAWDFPLFYPMPAVVVALPTAWLPIRLADAAVVGIGGFALAWALTRRTIGNPQLLVCVSAAMLTSAQTVQWSPLLTAAALTPSLGWLLACKPTIGAALWLYAPSRRSFCLAGGFALLTVLIWPWWVREWLTGLSSATHMRAPVQEWGGPLILLSLLKWRRPEARMLAALACVPQTPVIYETVPLFLVVATLNEGLILVALMVLAGQATGVLSGGADYREWMQINSQVMVALAYLPCAAMVLTRPNSGHAQPVLQGSSKSAS